MADESVQCSDLAADAARRALAQAGATPADVDLVVFAAASQDMLEPATAHIVQEKLGTSCQLFDVKNACNSFLNGLQVAESLILSGASELALVTTGEICSRAVAWGVRDHLEFRRNFPGYTMGDAGAAVVLGRSRDDRGIFYRRFISASRHWPLATIPGAGSLHPRGDEFTYLHADGARLKQAFVNMAPCVVARILGESGTTFDDFDRILVHQATLPYLDEMLDVTGIPRDRVEITIAELGNMASASLPVAFARAAERGAIAQGDTVLWFGLASGISAGAVMMRV